ncbi:MAG: BON domain-containing protein [Thermoleophilaceae bacterium]
MSKLLFGAAIGAAAAWFLDPNEGTRRRNVTRDKAMKYARRGKAEAARQASYTGHTIKGKASAVSPGTSREPAAERLNDPALQAKIESEVFRDPDMPKDRVSVNVEDGIAYLRGEVDSPTTIARLREAAAKVDGVRGVDSLLHTPGEPAPTKI